MAQAGLPDILKDIKLAESLFKEDRVLEAYHLLNNIEKYSKSLEQKLQSAVESAIASSKVTSEIRTNGSHIASLLHLLNDFEPWSVWNTALGTRQDITVSIHKNEEKGNFFFKIEGEIHCELIHVIAALFENELYSFWMPLCKHSEVISKPSQHRRIVKSDFDFTLVKREAYYNVYSDVLHDGEVLMSIVPAPAPAAPHQSQPNKPTHPPASLSSPDTNNGGNSGGGNDKPPPRMDITGGILLRSALHTRSQPRKDPSIKLSSVEKYDLLVHKIMGSANHDAQEIRKGSDSGAVHVLQRINRSGKYHGSEYEAASGLESESKDSETASPATEHKDPASAPSPKPFSARPAGVSLKSIGFDNDEEDPQDTVHFSAVFLLDPKFGFVPDWIFNMAIRSAISTFIPMLEHQARQFADDGIHSSVLDDNAGFYEAVEARVLESSRGERGSERGSERKFSSLSERRSKSKEAK